MYKNLITKEVKEHKWKIIIGLILLIVVGASLPLTFEFMFEMLDMFDGLPGNLGEQLAHEMNFYLSNYEVYLWSQWNGKNLTQIAVVISLLLGATAIASEVGKGTMEYLLTKPVSRFKILTSKIIVGVGYIAVLIIIPTIIMLLISEVMGKPQFGVFVTMGLIPVFLGMVASYFLALLFSIYCDDSIKAFAYSAGIIILNFVFAFFSTTEKLSLSYHYKGIAYIRDGSFPYLSVGVLLLVSVVLASLSYRSFMKREY